MANRKSERMVLYMIDVVIRILFTEKIFSFSSYHQVNLQAAPIHTNTAKSTAKLPISLCYFSNLKVSFRSVVWLLLLLLVVPFLDGALPLTNRVSMNFSLPCLYV